MAGLNYAHLYVVSSDFGCLPISHIVNRMPRYSTIFDLHEQLRWSFGIAWKPGDVLNVIEGNRRGRLSDADLLHRMVRESDVLSM